MNSFRSLPVAQKNYFWHSLLFRIGLGVTDIFGVYLFYELTHSFLIVLVALALAYGVGFLARWLSLLFLLPFHRRTNGVVVVGLTLALLTGVNCTLFVFQDSFATHLIPFVALLCVFFSANGMYFLFSNMLKYSIIGDTAKPGLYSSFLEIARAVSIVIAGVVALLLNREDSLAYLFLFGTVFLLLSLMPLRHIPALNVPSIVFNPSLRSLFSRLNTRAVFGNIGHGIVADTLATVIPLFLIAQYAGVNTPVTVTSIALIGSALLLYATGILWDKKSHRWVFYICGVLFIAGLLTVPYVALTPFIGMLLLVIGIAQGVLRVGFDAHLGADVATRGNPLESAVAIEIARTLGSLFAVMVGLLAFLFLGVVHGLAIVALGICSLLFVTYALKGAPNS